LTTAATSPTWPHVVILDALGFVAEVVAALIDRHDLEILRQRRHLVTPGVPEVREAVNHHHQRALAKRRIVNLHAAFRDGVAVRHAIEDVGLLGRHGRRDREHDNESGQRGDGE
jgi:hypothetical protein